MSYYGRKLEQIIDKNQNNREFYNELLSNISNGIYFDLDINKLLIANLLFISLEIQGYHVILELNENKGYIKIL